MFYKHYIDHFISIIYKLFHTSACSFLSYIFFNHSVLLHIYVIELDLADMVDQIVYFCYFFSHAIISSIIDKYFSLHSPARPFLKKKDCLCLMTVYLCQKSSK